jgi:hypothetical protein
MLTAMNDPSAVPLWLRNGGDVTLLSFGAGGPYDMPKDVEE